MIAYLRLTIPASTATHPKTVEMMDSCINAKSERLQKQYRLFLSEGLFSTQTGM